jgi:triosephosphate isomerase
LAGAPFALAYEPIWAIWTGVTPTSAEIEEVHGAIRHSLSERWPGAQAPILYGGSVKPDNAAEILGLAEVGGALVGGASLTAAHFLPIVRAA